MSANKITKPKFNTLSTTPANVPSKKSLLKSTLEHFTRNENIYTDEKSHDKVEFLNKSVISELSKKHSGAKIYKQKKKCLESKSLQEKSYWSHCQKIMKKLKLKHKNYHAQLGFTHDPNKAPLNVSQVRILKF